MNATLSAPATVPAQYSPPSLNATQAVKSLLEEAATLGGNLQVLSLGFAQEGAEGTVEIKANDTAGHYNICLALNGTPPRETVDAVIGEVREILANRLIGVVNTPTGACFSLSGVN